VGLGVGVGLDVGVGLGVGVGPDVGVGLGVGVGPGVDVGVGVSVGPDVDVGVGVSGVDVSVGVSALTVTLPSRVPVLIALPLRSDRMTLLKPRAQVPAAFPLKVIVAKVRAQERAGLDLHAGRVRVGILHLQQRRVKGQVHLEAVQGVWRAI